MPGVVRIDSYLRLGLRTVAGAAQPGALGLDAPVSPTQICAARRSRGCVTRSCLAEWRTYEESLSAAEQFQHIAPALSRITSLLVASGVAGDHQPATPEAHDPAAAGRTQVAVGRPVPECARESRQRPALGDRRLSRLDGGRGAGDLAARSSAARSSSTATSLQSSQAAGRPRGVLGAQPGAWAAGWSLPPRALARLPESTRQIAVWQRRQPAHFQGRGRRGRTLGAGAARPYRRGHHGRWRALSAPPVSTPAGSAAARRSSPDAPRDRHRRDRPGRRHPCPVGCALRHRPSARSRTSCAAASEPTRPADEGRARPGQEGDMSCPTASPTASSAPGESPRTVATSAE